MLGGDVSTESGSPMEDDLSRLLVSGFVPGGGTDVGIKVGEFGEEVPRRGPVDESRSVLDMLVDRVATECDVIAVEGGCIELLNAGDDIGRDIRVWTTLDIGADIGGGIGGGTVIDAVMLGGAKDEEIREDAGCLVKVGCRIRENGFGRTVPVVRSVPVEVRGGCRGNPRDIVIGRPILDCDMGCDVELFLVNCGLELNVQSSWGGYKTNGRAQELEKGERGRVVSHRAERNGLIPYTCFIHGC